MFIETLRSNGVPQLISQRVSKRFPTTVVQEFTTISGSYIHYALMHRKLGIVLFRRRVSSCRRSSCRIHKMEKLRLPHLSSPSSSFLPFSCFFFSSPPARVRPPIFNDFRRFFRFISSILFLISSRQTSSLTSLLLYPFKGPSVLWYLPFIAQIIVLRFTYGRVPCISFRGNYEFSWPFTIKDLLIRSFVY